MAKQYIPGVSGLLTEPNPVDSPSNTLSEAENVVIEQRGKVQARHGLNIRTDDKIKYYRFELDGYGSPDLRQLIQVNHSFTNKESRNGGSFNEAFTDNIQYSSFADNDNMFFKLFQFKNSNDQVQSGFVVKQNRNEYGPFLPNGSTVNRFLINKQSSDYNFIYYKLNKDTGLIEKSEKIEYNTVTSIFNTKDSFYIKTEDGLAEANVDDIFRPTKNRFFTIRWPSFPELKYSFQKSNTFKNWFLTGYKCGVRFTFYRETGYTEIQGNTYESSPSKVYEIINNGEDTSLQLSLEFNQYLDEIELYKKWNEFTTSNGGRKFGIRLYRTKIVPFAEELPIDYFECHSEISFGSLFSAKIKYLETVPQQYYQAGDEFKIRLDSNFDSTIYNIKDAFGELLIGDKVAFLNNITNPNYNGVVFSEKDIKLNTSITNSDIDINDYNPAKLEVVDKGIYNTYHLVPDITHVNKNSVSLSYIKNTTNQYYIADNSITYSNYFGFTIFNTDTLDQYVNQLSMRVGLTNVYIEGEYIFNSSITIPDTKNILRIVKGSTFYDTTLPIGQNTLVNIVSVINASLVAQNAQLLVSLHEDDSSAFPNSGLDSLFFLRITYLGDLPNSTIFRVDGTIQKSSSDFLGFGTGYYDYNNHRIKLPESASIQVSIYEYDSTNSYNLSNKFLKLGRKIASSEIIAEKDTKYLTQTGSYDYFYSQGNSGFLNFTFDQIFKMDATKKYFMSFTTKNFNTNKTLIGMYANSYIDRQKYNIDVFKWSNSNPIEFKETIDNSSAFGVDLYTINQYNYCFTRKKEEFWYKFKAITTITDNNGSLPTVLNPSATDDKDLYLSMPKGYEADPKYSNSNFPNLSFNSLTGKITVDAGLKNGLNVHFSIDETAIYQANTTIGRNNKIWIPVLNSDLSKYNFQVGSIVECIYSDNTLITRGSFYTISEQSTLFKNENTTYFAIRDYTATNATYSNAKFLIVDRLPPNELIKPITILAYSFSSNIATLYFNYVSDIYSNYQVGDNMFVHSITDETDYNRSILTAKFSGIQTITNVTNEAISFKISSSMPVIPHTTLSKTGRVVKSISTNHVLSVQQTLNPLTSTFSVYGINSFTFYRPNQVKFTKMMKVLASDALVNNQVLIKTFLLDITTSDTGITDKQRLYTNSSIDGLSATNMVAPNSKLLIPYKDFYIHAGLKKPLEALMYVTGLPKTEQAQLHPMYQPTPTTYSNEITSPEYYTKYELSTNTFKLLSSTSFINNNINNGVLYIDSSIMNNGTARIIDYNNNSLIKTNINSCRIYATGILANLGTTNFKYKLNQLKFKATIFERPYLTLKLTSLQNEINYVTIQTESLYNQNGYYSNYKTDLKNSQKYLEANDYINNFNSFQNNSSQTIVGRGHFEPGMVAGTNDGQCRPDITHTANSFRISESSSPIYYSAIDKKLVLTGINKFDIGRFESPGHILLELRNDTGYYSNEVYYMLINYSNIVNDQTTAKKYTFNNATIVYQYKESTRNELVSDVDTIGIMSSNQSDKLDILDTTTHFKTANAWFIKTSGDKDIYLYDYNKPILREVRIAGFVDAYNQQYDAIYEDWRPIITPENLPPPLTFLPHKNRSDNPVAVFSSDGNHTFIGVTAKTDEMLLDEYASLIVDRFNNEMQNKNIKATLRRGENIGEIKIEYPDGYSIEILNGKYDVDTNKVEYPGFHTFLPDISKPVNDSPSFTLLAQRNNNELDINNKAYISRREFPEICATRSILKIGDPQKDIIGYAQNADDLFIFKEDGIFRLTDSGNSSSNIPVVSSYQFSTTLICQAAGSIQEINDEIIFLSQYGFMSIANSSVTGISESIESDISLLIQTSPKYKIRSFVNKYKNLYYCTLINTVDPELEVKSGTYIFNTKTRQWSFMTEEIIDGMEDYDKRNLVAYRQKSVLAESEITPVYTTTGYYDKLIGTYNRTSQGFITYAIDQFNFSYPLQTVEKYRNFFYISRERHTDNIYSNKKDQYDFMSDVYVNKTIRVFPPPLNYLNPPVYFDTLTKNPNGLSLFIPAINPTSRFDVNYKEGLMLYYMPRYNDMNRYPISIYNEKIIIDSFIQYFVNRDVQLKLKTQKVVNGTTVIADEFVNVKITKCEYKDIYFGPTPGSDNAPHIVYTFEFLTTVKDWESALVIDCQILTGIPVKITFNPESGNSPDTNKLFQEFMVHTETPNKAMSMNFKIDGKSSFLNNDRKFEYDPSVTTRNVFRTYIPTKVARGRYLIRQVKHDVPLENLIITGQTIVMRDSGSTRVQKDKDNE